MANGFSLGLLSMMKDVAKQATPQYKIEPTGLLASLIQFHSPGVVKYDTYDGHYQTVKVKKKKRATVSMVKDTPSCTETNVNSYSEDTVSVAGFKQIAFHVEDEVIAAYDKYASSKTSQKGVSLLWELADDVLVHSSALLSAINADLVTLAAASIGTNKRTGLNTAAPINFSKDTNIKSLTDGLTLLYSDWKANNMSGRPAVIGAGLFYNYIAEQAAKVANQSGLDTRVQAAGLDFFYDPDWAAAVGANHIGVWEKDAMQLVEYLQYQGFKAGEKGNSIFGVTTVPAMLPAKVGAGQPDIVGIDVDFQLIYNECAQEFDTGGEAPVMLEKGYNMILSKRYGLWTIPADAYRTGDPLEGNRGNLLYEVTNDCDTCDGGGY